MYKKVKLNIIPVDESDIYKFTSDSYPFKKNEIVCNITKNTEPIGFYLTTDDDIYLGDYVFYNGLVIKVYNITNNGTIIETSKNGNINYSDCVKIVASTDFKDGLPNLSHKLINYIKYNVNCNSDFNIYLKYQRKDQCPFFRTGEGTICNDMYVDFDDDNNVIFKDGISSFNIEEISNIIYNFGINNGISEKNIKEFINKNILI